MKFKNILMTAFLILILTTSTVFAQDNALNSTYYMPDVYGYKNYTNNPYGYEIVLLDSLKLNEDIVSIESRFESEDLVVEVLYDNFYNTLDSYSTYKNYGNMGIKENEDFNITAEYYHDFNGQTGHVVLYERRKVQGNNDKNYYAAITFQRTSKEIVTVFIKSNIPVYIDKIMRDFNFIEKSGELKDDKVFEPVKKKFDVKTQEFYDKYFINNEKVDFGVFEPAFPYYPYMLDRLESLLNYNFPVALLYNTFELPFKTEYMNNAKSMGRVIEYTLYTQDKINGEDKDITLDILEGKYDDYLKHLAQSFNEYDFPILFRLNNEMNGAWVPYSTYFVGKDTDLYIDCWRYIYNKFQDYGVDNLIWVWNPNERSFPNYSYNHYLNYYPGNEYVDVVGLTAYNTGNYYTGEIWRSFSEAYDHFYYEYIDRFKHPMMITEFSSAAFGGDKVAWFDDLFNTIVNYDRIKLAVLWNGRDLDPTQPVETIARDYRLDKDENVINSIRNGLQKYK